MRVPFATYRVQLNREFNFQAARSVVRHLHQMGISDLYASPIFRARRGSTHGYDVTNPLHLNPELGAERDFDELVEELRRYDMGLLLDIVPNHMAASPENPWWMDVLENGASSPYSGYFNVEWHPVMLARGAPENKIFLPVLGAPYGTVLENQELQLVYEEAGFFVRYYEQKLPLDPKTYRTILELGPNGGAAAALALLIEDLGRLPARTVADPRLIDQRQRQKEAIKRKLWELANSNPAIGELIQRNLAILNGRKGDPHSFDLLDELLGDQAYRPAFWRLATERMNYWRFFDITDLVGVRTENPDVFHATHALICRLVNQRKVTALRVDHVDGLYDPRGYLCKLRNSLPCYVVVEKVLLGDEDLPEGWSVAGTTGYDFLNIVNGVLVDLAGMEALEGAYARFIGAEMGFRDTEYEQKKRVIGELFRGELRVLWNELRELAEQDRRARDLSPKELVEALVEVTACLPVYRTYIREFAVPDRDRAYIERAIEEASHRNRAISAPVFEYLKRVLLLESPMHLTDEQRDAWLRFVMRWQQFTGPVTAKGVEDTALYVYNRLVSLNEVGGGCRPVSVEAFHRFNSARKARWPLSMSATTTHDTKRSEDVRTRINVLSEMPEAWGRRVRHWNRWNDTRRREVRGRRVPDPNEEYLLYQTLLGAWPLDENDLPRFGDRVKEYMRKAVREAKVHTSWIHPDEEHEKALLEFVDAALEPSAENRFYGDFVKLQRTIAFYGAMSSLSQVLLKITAPGVPDFYQGTATWDFSLVDPDNRRPVDYPRLIGQMDALAGGAEPADLLGSWQDGRVKLFVTSKALRFRQAHPELFTEGDYLPLAASGARAENVLAFARRKNGSWAVVMAPRLVAKFCPPGRPPIGRRRWRDTVVVLPEDAPAVWSNVLTGETVKGRSLELHSALHQFPLALLWGGSGAFTEG